MKKGLTWLLFAFLSATIVLPIHAAEQNGAPNATGTQAAFPSGVSATITTTAHPTNGGTTFTANGAAFNGNPPASYNPQINSSVTTFNMLTEGTASGASIGANTPKGTLTITFSQPVTNPRIHFARLGGINGTEHQATAWTLTNGLTGTVADMTAVSGAISVVNAAGLARLQVTSNAPTTTCANPASTSGCGTVQVNGTYTTLTFNVFLQYRSGQATVPINQAADAYGVALSFNEDFGDAPTSYGSASHVTSGLHLGATATPAAGAHPSEADTVTTLYATAALLNAANPLASNTATGDADNAFSTPLPPVGVGTYTLNVPLSGATKAGRLCGWIDFNRDGAFGNNTAEEACVSFATAATTATLAWTVPTTAAYVAGSSYARFRIGYTAAEVEVPTADADSGEVEDWAITLAPRVQLSKVLSPAADPGLFNLSVSAPDANAVQTSTGVVANVGNGGTTGLVPVGLNGGITVSETAGNGTSLINYTSTIACVNRAGATVTLGGSGTSRTFTSMSSASTGAAATPATTANSNDTQVTCVATNSRNTGDLAITKTNTPGVNGNVDQASDTVTSGTPTTYTIVVTNSGPDTVTGAIVTDPVQAGLACVDPVPCTGAACPAATVPLSSLQGSGVILGTLANGGTVTFVMQCAVTASGL